MGSERLTIRAALAVFLALALAGCRGDTSEPADPSTGDAATVEWVNDGDTLTLSGGAKVRLVQIDAPELRSDCYGRAALRALIDLAPKGTPVTLVADPELDERDVHGRLLRYVYRDGIERQRRARPTRRGVAVLLPQGARRLRRGAGRRRRRTRATAGRATGARVPAPTSTRAAARSPGLPETAQRQGTSGERVERDARARRRGACVASRHL